ncbi:MAG: branched-chain amino acid ABC transporter permease [Proteobacteria bacterium]|nr:branched-chain amino acid ABC transporter permease [Pseudomonadota bacterium]MDA1332388.1 branched-chain amino acid ABC transporter permease [Pseudomonadota bacterium]
MDIFAQQVINGLVLGSVYAMVALGYTMVYGILGLINFAHGELVMIGAMIALAVVSALMAGCPEMNPFTMILIAGAAAILVCVLLAFFIERLAYRPLRNAPRLAPLITAIGISILLQNIAMIIWGRKYKMVPQIFPIETHELFSASITSVQLFIVAISGVFMAGLLLVVHFTKLGRAMRATSESQRVAGLMGINVNKIISVTFMIGAALGAVAGILVAGNYSVAHYSMGFMLGLKAFTAAVLGGIGNLGGAVLGGLLLGLIESIGAGYIGDLTGGFLGSNYQDVFAFVVLIVVLVFRPTGIMGERVSERA